MTGQRAPRSMAIVTPSFRGDLDRCALLVESLGHCAPGVTHYVIVDANDVPLFRPLASARTVIVDSREVLDPWLRRLPGNKGFWWSWRTPPVRGWMTQQLRKLAADRIIGEDILLCCDSDTVFVRPFGAETLMVDGKLGLLDVDFRDAFVERWTHSARRLLGLDPAAGAYRGHVGMLIAWHRDVLLALHQQIETVSGRPWQQAVARLPTFSEYITYGVFVREKLGYAATPHAPSSVELVRTSWGHRLDSQAAVDAFFAGLKPANVAVMVHSKDGIDPALYRHQVERLWSRDGSTSFGE